MMKYLSPLGAGDGRGALKGQQAGVRRGGTFGQANGAVSMGQLGGPPGRWLDDCEAHGSQLCWKQQWREEGAARPQSPHFPTALCTGDDSGDGGDDSKHLSKAYSVPGRPHIK